MKYTKQNLGFAAGWLASLEPKGSGFCQLNHKKKRLLVGAESGINPCFARSYRFLLDYNLLLLYPI